MTALESREGQGAVGKEGGECQEVRSGGQGPPPCGDQEVGGRSQVGIPGSPREAWIGGQGPPCLNKEVGGGSRGSRPCSPSCGKEVEEPFRCIDVYDVDSVLFNTNFVINEKVEYSRGEALSNNLQSNTKEKERRKKRQRRSIEAKEEEEEDADDVEGRKWEERRGAMVDRVAKIIDQLRGVESTVTRREVEIVLDGAHGVADEIYGMREAREWAGDFDIDKVINSRDANLLRECEGSLEEAARRRQQEMFRPLRPLRRSLCLSPLRRSLRRRCCRCCSECSCLLVRRGPPAAQCQRRWEGE